MSVRSLPTLSPDVTIACRPQCGACCIAPSISAASPKHPHGKPAGVRCGHLLADYRCELFGLRERPAVCGSLLPSSDMCGNDQSQAMSTIERWERETAPNDF